MKDVKTKTNKIIDIKNKKSLGKLFYQGFF